MALKSGSADEAASDEQFILRVEPPHLAEKLRKWLREEMRLEEKVQLVFEGESDRRGTLTVEGVAYPVWVLDLPTIVESYKSWDDMNLCKTADIGQVLLVQEPGSAPPPQLEPQEGATLPDQLHPNECPDGVTAPMRKAPSRQFRPRFTVSPEKVAHVEAMVQEMLAGRAPEGWSFADVEEEYVVDSFGEGNWVKARKKPPTSKGRGKQREGSPGDDGHMDVDGGDDD